MRALCCLMLFVSACDEEATGPLARIERTTGCVVPPGAVRVHDHLDGDAQTFVMHAKVVLPRSRIEDFVRSCGFGMQELQVGYDHRSMRPSEPLDWWNPPDRRLTRGAAHTHGSVLREVLVVPRDTDFAVFLKASGRVR